MTNKPPVTRAFHVRPATGSFLDLPGGGSFQKRPPSYLDRHLDRIVTLLSKRMLEDRQRPRG